MTPHSWSILDLQAISTISISNCTEAINLCNDAASIKMKLELSLSSCLEKVWQFSTLERKVAAKDLEEDKYNLRVKLPNFWMFPSYDLVTLQIIQTILRFLQTQWRTHTRCVRCVRTPCENFKFWYMKFSNLSLMVCVPIIIKSLKSLKRAQLSSARDSCLRSRLCRLCTVRRTLPGAWESCHERPNALLPYRYCDYYRTPPLTPWRRHCIQCACCKSQW